MTEACTVYCSKELFDYTIIGLLKPAWNQLEDSLKTDWRQHQNWLKTSQTEWLLELLVWDQKTWLVVPTCMTQFCGCCRCCLPISLDSLDSLDLLLLLDLKLTDFLTDNFRPIIFRKLSAFFWPGGVRPHSGHLQHKWKLLSSVQKEHMPYKQEAM